ncbi:exodeoxyribonuclease V subunit alpha [Ruania halotolerans]|uniref:exodeoxyribonuclease V subunit alpha n=1 Tax=Ruania halotolerans TaxID=2897773 RepID=UPI001E611A50|nr:exodeoxyribonuclease V subunit alpha [Ruania halotolerans]UFU07032.1 exodeoxyribonuclease V subunit alpha [Ruania halotolerans]
MSIGATNGADGDVRIAVGAPPLLARFNASGLVTATDVQVATRLGRLTGESDERVLLAVALTVRALRGGSVCLHLGEESELDALRIPDDAGQGEDAAAEPPPWPEHPAWVAAVQASPMVAVGVAAAPDGHGGGARPDVRPARWVNGRLYLDRFWRDELTVRQSIDARLTAPDLEASEGAAAAVRRLFPEAGDDRQRLAAAHALRRRLTVLTGGPGTGKTTTVARLLAVLQDVAGPVRVALAAPTGKAAARLQEAAAQVVGALPEADRDRVGLPEATTVHRLLGYKPGSTTRFAHDARHHLPHDVVVVDETSMVPLSLMARLLEALRPDTRLVLVGDADQLASVEAGAVLGDLVARPPVAAAPSGLGVGTEESGAQSGVSTGNPAVAADLGNGVVRLTTVHRQKAGSEILPLAAAIRTGDADRVLELLRAGRHGVELVAADIERLDEATIADLRRDAVTAGEKLVAQARAGNAAGALEALNEHRLMLAHRRGPAGVARWAAQVEAWVQESAAATGAGSGYHAWDPWAVGRPILVTSNDKDVGLYNGDTGVLIADGEGVVAAFGDPERPMMVRTHRLPPVETVHAMTVHRAQGSQFGRVSLILPPATSPLLTRELLYTAVTRAQEFVRVVGSEEAVRAAVAHPVRRASGLRVPLPSAPA